MKLIMEQWRGFLQEGRYEAATTELTRKVIPHVKYIIDEVIPSENVQNSRKDLILVVGKTFSAGKTLPKELEDRYSGSRKGWELKFNSEHYYRYILTMKLRKEGYKLENIVKMISSLTAEEVRKKVRNWSQNNFENTEINELKKKSILAS